MTLDQIKMVVAIAENLSFNIAAYELASSPSSVSRQIKILEEELGVQLFNRVGKTKISLTKEGEVLLPHFRDMLESESSIHREIDILKGNETLRLATLPHHNQIESVLVMNLLVKQPSAKVIDFCLDAGAAYTALMDHRVDICMTTFVGPAETNPAQEKILQNDKIRTIEMISEGGYFVVNVANPLSKKPCLTLDDIASSKNTDIMISSFSSNISQHYSDLFSSWSRDHGKQLRFRVASTHSNYGGEIVNAYIKDNPRYVAIVRDILIRNEYCVKVPIRDENIRYTTYAFYLKDNESSILKAFVGCVKKFVEERKEKP